MKKYIFILALLLGCSPYHKVYIVKEVYSYNKCSYPLGIPPQWYEKMCKEIEDKVVWGYNLQKDTFCNHLKINRLKNKLDKGILLKGFEQNSYDSLLFSAKKFSLYYHSTTHKDSLLKNIDAHNMDTKVRFIFVSKKQIDTIYVGTPPYNTIKGCYIYKNKNYFYSQKEIELLK